MVVLYCGRINHASYTCSSFSDIAHLLFLTLEKGELVWILVPYLVMLKAPRKGKSRCLNTAVREANPKPQHEAATILQSE